MILDRLKHETREAHIAAERAVEQYRYLESIDGYRQLLERFWGFYTPFERQIAARREWAEHGVDIEPRMKAPALARDLRALGHTPATLSALPECGDLPPLGEFPHVTGCLYVLEGATLGGQIITRQLGPTLGISAEAGGSFFASYGYDIGAMWRSYRALLVSVASGAEAEEAVLRGAHAMYDALRRWLIGGVRA